MQKIKIYGLGGQGVVTGAKILSHAVSIYEDMYATTIPAYGHERRGAPVYTDIMIDDKPILLNSFVYVPDIVVVMDSNMINKNVDVGIGIHSNSILVINSNNINLIESYRENYQFKEIFYVNATQIAQETIGKGIPNGAMLGALSGTNLVKIESIEKALIDNFKGKAGEMNASAARKAYQQIRKI